MKTLEKVKNSENFNLFILLIILIGGIFVRLYGIDSPVADWHSFRQVDTVSVSRLFTQNGINLLDPRYHDISTIQSGLFNPMGYRLVEFPIYNALIAFAFKSFSSISLEVWGRLISVFLATISGIIVYLLGKRFIGPLGGILGAAFFMFIPFNIYFTRVILPEPLATMFGLLGLVLFVSSEDKKSSLLLLTSSVIFSLALLSKPFIVFYFTPVVYLMFKNNEPKNIYGLLGLLKKYFWFGFISFMPFFLWRYWESRHPEGIPFFEWVFNGDGIRFRPAFWRWIFAERLGYMILGTWGILPFAYGLIKKTKDHFIHFFILGMFFYVCVVATANVRHDYYQTLTMPAISLVLSAGSIGLIKKGKFATVLLIFSVFIMSMVGLTRIREFYKIDHPEIIDAGIAADNILPKNALIIAPYNGDTAFLYQTKRTGWPYVDRPISEMIDKGAEYYISVNYDVQTNEFMGKFPIVKRTKEYVILDLKP